VEVLVLDEGGGLEAVAEIAAGLFEAGDGLVEGHALLAGGRETGDAGDAEEDVVEGLDVAIGGEGLGDGVGVRIGDGEERRQSGLEIRLDGGACATRRAQGALNAVTRRSEERSRVMGP
jgi:hypothetical protein